MQKAPCTPAIFKVSGHFSLLGIGLAVIFGLTFIVPSATESADANGDTRTISLLHSHTGESIDATFRVNGHYDQAVLDRLNWFLRDWRNDQPTKMDPRLFDVVWEAYRAAGATQPIVVFSAYRSPETNAMLRRRSRGVAEFSQHMLGKAMDTTMPGMPMEKIREIGMRMQRGGVGYYPSSNFVHLDVGSVRHWPRMSYDQLVRLFPDGKTVHMAANGQKLARYEEARAEIEANGGIAATAAEQNTSCFFGWLFGCRDEGEETQTAHYTRPSPLSVKQLKTAALQPPPAKPPMSWPPPKPITSIAQGYSANAIATAAARQEMEWNTKPVKPQDHHDNPQTTLIAASANSPLSPKPESKVVASLAMPTRYVDPAFTKHVEMAQDHLPIPPPRPLELAVSAAVPVPPIKPLSYAALPNSVQASRFEPQDPDKVVPINRLITESGDKASLQRAASLPVIITQGSSQASKQTSNGPQSEQVPSEILAYAPMARIKGLRSAANAKIAISEANVRSVDQFRNETKGSVKLMPSVPARIDRSNFRSVIAGEKFSHIPAQTRTGPLALRSVAHGSIDVLDGTPSNSGQAMIFAAKATNLATDHFSSTVFDHQTASANN